MCYFVWFLSVVQKAMSDSMKKSLILFLVASAILIPAATVQVFGHGIGSETLPPQMIGNYNSTIFLKSWPNIVDAEIKEKRIYITIYEIESEEHLHNMDIDFTVSKNGNVLFSDSFGIEEGVFSLVFLPQDSLGVGEEIGRMFENLAEPGAAERHVNKDVFSEGGLYDFDIIVRTVDSFDNTLEEPVHFKGALSIPKKYDYQTESGHNVSITSFYDIVDSFDFSPDSLSFSMPFDWSDENISQVSVVHEEIHIPKALSSWIVGDYYLEINDKTAPNSLVTIDDYSIEEERIIHLIIPQRQLPDFEDDLQQMRFELKPTSSPAEPLSAPTRNGEFDVTLQWDSANIVWGKPITFEIKIEDTFAPDKVIKEIPFHVSMIQEDKTIFEKKIAGMKNTESKQNTFEFTFEESHKGTVKLLVEDIDSNNYASTEFAFAVDAPALKFPITIPSQTKDGGKGSYDVDMTWIPADLIPGEESEFIFTIYKKDTKIPVFDAYYEFVIMQNGEDVLRKSGIAPAGGSYEEVVFSEENSGKISVRLEKIDNSEEYAEISVNIVPEFGSISILILAISVIVLLLTTSIHLQRCSFSRI